jgi:Mo-dependent nitrogenase C-terminus
MSYYLPTINSLRSWLDRFTVRNQRQAEQICKLIPSQCPFERDIKIFGTTILHIPPLCKLNPCYEELVALRFRAMCYLADECGMDISNYC